MSNFISEIESARAVLEYFNIRNTNSGLYNNTGFCCRISEFLDNLDSGEPVNNESKRIRDLVDEEFNSLDTLSIRELFEFGYSIQGSLSEEFKKRFAVHFIHVDGIEDLNGKLLKGFFSVRNLLESNCKNIIFIYIDDDTVESCPECRSIYSKDLFHLATEFKESQHSYNIEVFELDLLSECSSYYYKCQSLVKSSVCISSYLPIQSQAELEALDAIFKENKKLNLSDIDNKDLTSTDIACLAYLCIKNRCVLVTRDGSIESRLRVFYKTFYCQDWNSYYLINHISTLNEGYHILSTNSDFHLCTNIDIHTSYTVKYLPVEYLLDNSDERMLRHIISTKVAKIEAEDILEPSIILELLMGSVASDADKLFALINKAHQMAMYHLTDNLISFCDLAWVRINDALCFCVIEDIISDTVVEVIKNGSDLIQVNCSYKDILPLNIFDMSFSDVDTEALGDSDLYTYSELSFEFIDILTNPRYKLDFNRYCVEGKFKEALLCIYEPASTNNNDLYKITINKFGKEFVDKLAIPLSGSFDYNFKPGALI